MSFLHSAMGHIRRLPQRLLRQSMKRLLRLLFQLQGQRQRWAKSGFVLPTTVLLLLVVALTASALTYRAYSRSTQAILERQQQVITNATAPAVDRAKAKIDYLLTQDTRSPRKVPTSDQMAAMLQATVSDPALEIVAEPLEPDGRDFYSLPGDTRLDINGDGTVDNAWYFTSDLNNDGAVADDEVVAYSILIDDNNSGIDLNDDVNDAKAEALVTRNGPISTSEVLGACETAGADTGQRSAEGWQVANGTTIEKNFQVNAFVANLNDVSRTASTLEFQQVRSAARSNKWGAWFRYDLSISPGTPLHWNGAMHTQGSLLLRSRIKAYMISSTKSCLYDESASEITLGAEDQGNNFKGQLISGFELAFFPGNQPVIHVDDGDAQPAKATFGGGSDSINTDGSSVVNIMLDPVEVYLNDVSKHIDSSTWSPQGTDANYTDGIRNTFSGRVRNINANELRNITLDDAFRADNRWGPKKVYDPEDAVAGQVPSGTSIGTDIGSISKLTNESGGLDGYWERQAINSGARIIVGERLELGDASGWNYNPVADTTSVTPGDALYPPNAVSPNTAPNQGKFGYAEQKQRTSLRDNLAAVQGMVVYKYGANFAAGQVPQACIAVTAHPGTLQTRVNSRTFRTRTDGSDVMTDFLAGNGTNGWEFRPVSRSGTNIQNALQNLANFAGDPKGGAPSFTPVQDSFIHPYPYMSMWGDFSALRRIEDGGGNSSPADDTYEDTAACTLGLLAYNLTALKGEYDAITADNWQDLATELTTAYTPGLETQSYEAWQNAIATATYRPWVEAGYRYWQIERDRSYGFLRDVGLPGVATAAFGGSYSDANAEYTPSGTGTIYTGSSYEVTCDPSIFVDAKYGITNEDDAISLALATCPKKAAVSYPSLYYLFPVADHAQDGGETLPAGTFTINQPSTSSGALQPEPYIDLTVDDYGENNSFTVVDYTGIAASPRAADGSDWVLPTGTVAVGTNFTASWGTDGSDSDLPDNAPFRLVVTDSNGANPSAFDVSILDKGVFDTRELLSSRLLDLDVGALAEADWIPGKSGDVEHNGLVYAYREDAVREDEIVRPSNGGTAATCNTYAVLKDGNSGPSNCFMNITADALTSKDPPLADNNISLKPIDYAPDPDRRPYGFRLRNGVELKRDAEEQSGISFITDNVVAIQGNFNVHKTRGSTFTGASSVVQEEFDTKMIDEPLANNDAAYYDKFYGRGIGGGGNLNLDDFANSSKDDWRPAEVLADAIYINSEGFKDGFVEAAYIHNASGADDQTFRYPAGNADGLVSYQNRNPFGKATSSEMDLLGKSEILREGKGSETAPIYFDRNGVIYGSSGNYLVDDEDNNPGGSYYYWGFGNIGEGTNPPPSAGGDLADRRRRYVQEASGETTINALLISGIVPAREQQLYGGLAVFPRFSEFWSTNGSVATADLIDLNIAGGFFQLFFSTSATAPFDQDAWEANEVSNANNFFNYYNAPNRVWGYDVALQYSPQSPIASRFTSVGDPRSEFYRELPVDDPYIKILRCAEYTPGVQIDPKASCS